MIRDVIDRLVLQLTQLAFIDRLAGLVKTTEFQTMDMGGKPLLRRVPQAVDEPTPNFANCEDPEGLFRLVPDERKRCIVFFEGSPATPVQLVSDTKTRYSVRTSLVCWYNSLGFTPNPELSTSISTAILSRVRKASANPVSAISNLKIDTGVITDNAPTIFGSYTFSDRTSGYLSHPFGAFKVDLTITFTLYESQSCIIPVVPIPIVGCC